MNPKQRIGARLVQLRDRASMTQEEVCAEAGISQSYYSEIERGKRNASIDMLVKIADALETTLERIFRGM